eukprot:scaffold40570_cov45-Attheya_sp.AAC.1
MTALATAQAGNKRETKPPIFYALWTIQLSTVVGDGSVGHVAAVLLAVESSITKISDKAEADLDEANVNGGRSSDDNDTKE